MKLRMPVGYSDFKALIDDGYFYVDKTLLIKAIIDDSLVTLFTRPRRFGKTLNLSMLQYFFGYGDNEYLFRDKNIWSAGEKYKQKQGKYPVIFFSLKDIKTSTFEDMFEEIKAQILFMLAPYENIITGPNIGIVEKQYYERILLNQGTVADYRNVLKYLSATMHEYYKSKVVILIDEYDTPLNSAHINSYEKEAIEFMRGLLSGAFKDNVHLERGVISGINRIAKENIFSGLNNLVVNTVYDDTYSQYFGITELELKDMLTCCGIEDQLSEIKKWYNGYNIGGYDIYNPWSVINYIKYRKLQPYWVNTGSNDLIVECIQRSNKFFKDIFAQLMNGEAINAAIEKEMTYDRLDTTGNILGLFMNSGYLTLADNVTKYDQYNVKIPNYEIKDEFDKIIAKSLNTEYSTMITMFSALIKGDYEQFKELYSTIVKQTLSFYDTKENAYHMFTLGMSVSLKDIYNVKSNLESGDGRSDIICYPKNIKYPPIIIEFKTYKADNDDVSNDKLGALAVEAVKQVKDNEYYIDFKNANYKKCIVLGIAHYKKNCEIVMEELKI